MKKEVYKAPQIKQIALLTTQMISASVGIGSDKVNADQSFSNERGERNWEDLWGDLWK